MSQSKTGKTGLQQCSEILDRYERDLEKRKEEARKAGRVCKFCGAPVLGEGYPTLDNKLACNGCYYEALGELIEAHPITSPRCGHGHAIGEGD